MSQGETVKRGYLTKSPPENKAKVAQWHKRWFLLMDSKLVYPLADRYVRLEYYQSEAEALRLADPKGMINLKDCNQVISREPIKGHKFVFDVCTEDRTYHLAAENAQEKHDWIQTLNNLLFTEQNNRQRRWSPPQQRADIAARARLESAGRTQRPLSFTGSPSTSHSPRPLPPVPAAPLASSPLNHKRRPLPPPPSSAPPGHKSPQISPRQNRKREPPPKPAPYGKSVSVVTPPAAADISDHYEVAVPKASAMNKRTQRMGGQSRSLDENISVHKAAPNNRSNDDQEYSILQESKVSGYDPSNQNYSHLELNGTTGHCTPEPILTQKKRTPESDKNRDYENLTDLSVPDDEDYSHLKY